MEREAWSLAPGRHWARWKGCDPVCVPSEAHLCLLFLA